MSGKQLLLEKGQIWKIEGQYLHISELGKKLVHYRLLKTIGQRAARGRLANRQEVFEVLQQQQATLLNSRSE